MSLAPLLEEKSNHCSYGSGTADLLASALGGGLALGVITLSTANRAGLCVGCSALSRAIEITALPCLWLSPRAPKAGNPSSPVTWSKRNAHCCRPAARKEVVRQHKPVLGSRSPIDQKDTRERARLLVPGRLNPMKFGSIYHPTEESAGTTLFTCPAGDGCAVQLV